MRPIIADKCACWRISSDSRSRSRPPTGSGVGKSCGSSVDSRIRGEAQANDTNFINIAVAKSSSLNHELHGDPPHLEKYREVKKLRDVQTDRVPPPDGLLCALPDCDTMANSTEVRAAL